jgi:hypothetical protein
MKLIMENWNKFQLVTEAKAIHALFESEAITEAEFMDRIKRFAKKKGVPLAVALSLATGAMAPSAAQAAPEMPDDVPVQVDQQQKQNSLKDLLGGVVNRNANGEATSLTVAVKLGRLTNLTQSEASHKLDRLAQKEGINAQGAKSAETQMLEGAPYMVVTQQIAAP